MKAAHIHCSLISRIRAASTRLRDSVSAAAGNGGTAGRSFGHSPVGNVGAMLAFAILLAAAPAARAGVAATYYVSPNGAGSSCTSAAPCSLATAKAQVSALNSMTGDIVVQLADGSYPLTATLSFTASDSGKSGYHVIYAAAPGAAPILRGDTGISGWSPVANSTIWQAPLPAALNGFAPRQIYVNGVRAQVVRAAAASFFGTMTATKDANGNITGFTFTATGPNSWGNVGDVDVVFGPGTMWPWTHAICPVSSLANGAVTLPTDCAQFLTPMHATGLPSAVENNYALLGTPGQFYVDRSANVIYYVPRPGEDMTTATVVAGLPGTQALVSLSGTSNIQFKGIAFEYVTWQFDSAGVVNLQADMLHKPTGSVPLPAGVSCTACNNVAFIGDTFSHLGGSALGLGGGGSGNSIIGCIFSDISGNGIEIGGDPYVLESNYLVANNVVYDVANEYPGGLGIFGTWVTGTTVVHNEVAQSTYSGISIGWGWGYNTSQTGMTNNHIEYNYVHDVMMSGLYDGGPIYVNGIQGGPGTIQYNYLVQSSELYAGLYLDNGSSNWTVQNNVVGGYVPYWLLVQRLTPSANYNTVQNNYVGSDVGGIRDSGPATNTIANNSTGLGTWPAAAQTIIGNAGPQAAYISASSIGETDVAYKAAATASSSWSGLTPSMANDERAGTIWSSGSNDTAAWWQTDLGQAYPLSKIQLLFRQDSYDQPTTRVNLEVWVSNNADPAQGHAVACAIDAVPYMYKGSYDCVPPAGTWRYVRVVKTDNQSLVLAEVRAFDAVSYATLPSPDVNLARVQGASASASSVWSSRTVASNALDDNTSTIYASSDNDAGPWWELSLPSQSNLTYAELVFRQDIDQPTTRENFQVWVSNASDMSQGHTVACSVGASPLPYKSTYTCPLPPGPWQYVAVEKTDKVELVFSEFRVYGH